MKKYLLAAISSLALAASSSAWAADATVVVSGGSNPGSATYTLNSLTMDANGNVTLSVTAIGGGNPNPNPTPTTKTLTVSQPSNGQIRLNGNPAPATSSYTCVSNVDCPTVTLTLTVDSGYTAGNWSGGVCSGSALVSCSVPMNQSSSVSATVTSPGTPPVPGNCPAASYTEEVTTLTGAQFVQKTYSPQPSQVYAFKMTTGSSSMTGGVGTAVGARATSGNWVVISECPGDIQSAGKEEGCYRHIVEAGTLRYAVNRPDLAGRPQYCTLQPNKNYYVNVAKRTSATSGTTCDSATTCSFYFSGY